MALLMRVSALVEVIPEMVELELEPVSVQPPGKGAIVLDARLRLEAPRSAKLTGNRPPTTDNGI